MLKIFVPQQIVKPVMIFSQVFQKRRFMAIFAFGYSGTNYSDDHPRWQMVKKGRV